ncbi:deleted in malignant brain tumors 1 -like [Chlorella sorokiniana]|uniref:Deleted in malignant brain tumors 1-like n=1 Tax=Chlorella sorokiniana TaxID=3076 RepID=A0A2P6U4R3_CHLSO|nr:deleted in malignant brain tumors 1 -like [Chlorella sorokiniana]|eukprot:PRW61301.1 deleted in malignant brain tumors 1 -like [Chlorella sorokiniana]
MHRAAMAAVLLAASLVACAAPAAAQAAGGAPAAGRGTAQPTPLARPRSWAEAWAALSPYQASPTVAVAGRPGATPCNTTAGPCRQSPRQEQAFKELWKQWKAKYKRSYSTAEDAERYGYFIATVTRMVTKLSDIPKTLWVGLNSRADWSPSQLRAAKRILVPAVRKPSIRAKNLALPNSWDWRASGLDKVTPAKDQGRCGSCFAFASVAAIESKLLIQYNRTARSFPIDLSEQQVVDCVAGGPARYLSAGCNGGLLEEPLDYTSRQFLVKEALYPYTSGTSGKRKACNGTRLAAVEEADRVQLTGGGFRQLQQWSAQTLREAVRVAPVMVGFYVPEDSLFEYYSGGIWPANSCKLPPGRPSNAQALVNHALLVVGYDMTVPGNHHWIVKNSFGRGEEWGENGFGRIAMLPDGTYGTCFMYYYMITPTELVPTGLPIVPEPARTSLRLNRNMGNGNQAPAGSGRLEVLHNGRWGTVCTDGFTNAAATVVCKQLGLGNAGTAVPNAGFGQGAASSPVWLDEVSCRGDEDRLEACVHAGWGVTNCGHKEDVGVICSTEAQVTARLVEATKTGNTWSGRLELKERGAWVPACASGFNNAAATVVCKQLNLGVTGTALPNNAFGTGSGSRRLQSVNCAGNEATWEGCRSAVFSNTACNAKGDVAIRCSGAAPGLRLVSNSLTSDNSFVTRGRLEVRMPDKTWSTVCDDGFSDEAASVVCRQLGLSRTGFALPWAYFGEGTGPIGYDNVACTGKETTLQQCPRAQAKDVDCTHREDVGVVCSDADPRVLPAVKLRLVNGTKTQGRLEVNYAGTWGTVCADYFPDQSATVACRQIGFLNGTGTFLISRGEPKYGQGTGPILLDDVRCSGREASIADCPNRGWGVHNCKHTDDVSLQCFDGPIQARLTNQTRQMGQLEVLTDGQWGSVCGAFPLDHKDAQVVCTQLGIPGPALKVPYAFYGPGAAPFSGIDFFTCEGTEQRLDQCQMVKNLSPCEEGLTVSVACNTTVKLRLVGGNNAMSGRLEMAVNDVWGRVLWWSAFNDDAATVACRQMGLPTPGRVLPAASFGTGKGPIWIAHVNFCSGQEAGLQDCNVMWGIHFSFSFMFSDAAIQCDAANNPVPLRLVGRDGTASSSGRLELLAGGSWGTAVDRFSTFDHVDATVVCKQLGLPLPGRSVGGSYWGPGSGPQVLDWIAVYDLGCKGNETRLDECLDLPLSTYDFPPTDQVGVECGAQPLKVRLANTTQDGTAGRLEVQWQGQWGTVCCGSRDCYGSMQSVADTLCKQLGKPTPGRLVDTPAFGPGTGPVLLDFISCPTSGASLEQCSYSINNVDCNHTQDVGLICGAPAIELRLQDGVAGKSGRLEMKVAGQWGTVCGGPQSAYWVQDFYKERFDDRAATVACRAMGLQTPGRVLRTGGYGAGSTGRVWASSFFCTGGEPSLDDCYYGFWGRGDGCTPANAVSIECGITPPAAQLSLVEGVPGKSGRLEVTINGTTGTVVPSYLFPTKPAWLWYNWSSSANPNNIATVACQQLGLPLPGKAVTDETYGYGKGPKLLASIVCSGSEPGIEYCSYDFNVTNAATLPGPVDLGIVCGS